MFFFYIGESQHQLLDFEKCSYFFMLLRVCNQAKRLFPTMYPYALLWLRLVLGLNV